MLLLATFFLLAYVRIYLQWYAKIKTLQEKPYRETEVDFSVVIAFRNEMDNLPFLLKDLECMDYQHGKWEVLLVDDHSTDAGPRWIEKHGSELPMRCIRNAGQGKKAAIETGIAAAQNSQILLTDADCSLSSQWLKAMNAYLSNATVVLGPVKLVGPDSWATYFQKIDMAMMQIATALSLKNGRFFLANGANLSYPKISFENSDGFQNESTPSGDDILFLQQLEVADMDCAWQPAAIVETAASASLRSFLQQRLRWGSKTRNFTGNYARWVSLVIFFTNAFLSMGLVSLIFYPLAWKSWVALVLIKFGVELLLLIPSLRFFGIDISILKMAFLQIPHIFYITIVGILSQFQSFQWKGRKYN